MVHELHSDVALKLKKEIETKTPNNFESIRKKLVKDIAANLIEELDKTPSLEGRLLSEKRDRFVEKIKNNERVGA